MALERYWDYAYSVSRQGNNTYHGPLEKQAAGGIGTQTSGCLLYTSPSPRDRG